MKFDSVMKVSAILIIAFCILVNVKMADASWHGKAIFRFPNTSISEQSNVGYRYTRSQKYHGLYGLRHSKMYTPSYRNVYNLKLSSQYKR